MPTVLTTPTFSNPTAPLLAQYVAATSRTTRSVALDLRGKFGAMLQVRIGRRVVTALDTAARIIVRPTYGNDAAIHPTIPRFESTIAVVGLATTITASQSIGDDTLALTSATGVGARDVGCLHSNDTSGLRIEFVEVFSKASLVLTLTSPMKLAHTSGDSFTIGADVWLERWVPGGFVYEVRGLNYANQALLMEVLVTVYDNDTST